jgi:3'-phosphoadenosine 5'-phosphosulfate sulfotransferase (PAPS reductase)/FAD synthetase
MRVISWFSCGAASAIATVIAAIEHPGKVQAVYCRVREEHPDNLRFLADFERIFNIPVEIITNKEHDGSIYNVFLKRKFIKGPQGAPCTMILKKDMRKKYQCHDDVQVFGYTVEEQDRADRFIDSNNEVKEYFPLIANNITKADTLRLIRQSGIELPTMYKMGYSNNNCIGCVKGGMGYWNKIRIDFPDAFDKMAKLERFVGHAINKGKEGAVYLDTLSPTRGNKKLDMPADCGFTCEIKEN